MEHRKAIPIIETEFKNLNGTAIVGKDNIPVSGDLFFTDSDPCFCGTWRLSRTMDDMPEFTLNLKDSERHRIICANCRVSEISHENECVMFKAKILKLTIQKGKIDKEDEVEIFSALRIKEFSGEEFDQNNHRCVNILEFVSKNARLYSVPIPEISNCNGYLYFPMKKSEFKNSGRKLIDKLCSLLSFVSANFVDSPYRVLWKNAENYIIQICPGMFSNKGEGIFKITTPGIVQHYFINAWTAWDHYIGKIDLLALMNYYVLIENQEFIEAKILIGCVWMEAIKYEYASNIAKYKKNNYGYFLKPNSPIKFSFKELIQEVYRNFGISNGDLSFIKHRNEIVHQGKISLSFEDKFDLCDKLIFSIENIMLKILDYKGDIWDRLNRKHVNFS